MIIAERQSLLNAGLLAAGSRGAFMQAMNQVVSAFGFSHVSIMTVPTPNESLFGSLIVESTIPLPFIREFDRHQYLRDCIIMPRPRSSHMPHQWTLDDIGPSESSTCPPEMLELLRRFDLIMGILFPVSAMDGSRFLIRFDGQRPPLSQMEINELGMLSIQAFEVYDRMSPRAANTVPTVLSARELEVVRWTAQGKTSVEIGRILSLSDHTVNAYLTNAIKKLDCVNRTQLVAKAIRLKLIT